MFKSRRMRETIYLMCVIILLSSFFYSRADALGDAANAICFEPGMCQYGTRCGKNGPPGVLNKPCQDVTSNLTITGKCVAPYKCEGVSGQGAGGEGTQAVTQALGQMMQQLMQQLMQGGGGGGGGGAGAVSSTTYGTQGCTSYYQVSAPSSDPCAIYNPSALQEATGASGVGSALINALGGTAQPSVSSQLNTSINAGTQTNTGTTPPPQMPTTPARPAPAQGLSGDLRVGSAGATVIANLRQGLSEVAGFFGGSTGGASGALNAAGKLCSTRPWSGNGFVGGIIPTSFFDGLCEWRGYQVGVITPTGTSRITPPTSSGASAQKNMAETKSSQAQVTPEVDIWAEPASVRLGTRTYIFWNSKGVVSCSTTGPSFSQNSFSGGASTVPISGPTTFAIECLTAASTTVKDSVTVQIAI